jgi:hypothetical protein
MSFDTSLLRALIQTNQNGLKADHSAGLLVIQTRPEYRADNADYQKFKRARN